MQAVKVSKKELIEKLTENRNKHQDTYAEAREGYAKRAAELAKRMSDSADDPDRVKEAARKIVSLPQPESHDEDYERALAMLEWEVGEEVELSRAEFTQFVQDDWGWKDAFSSTTALYSR